MIYLLDTNVCIAVMRRRSEVCATLLSKAANDCAVSTITVYELHSGIQRCAHPIKEQQKVETMLAPIHRLPFDETSAIEAGKIRWDLERRGQVIGPHDIMIAAQAIALDLTLVTHNTGEFSRIPGLKVEDWQS